MQRKGRKYKDKIVGVIPTSYHKNISNKLHSIPKLKKNVKSNVLYSIPSVCMLALCLGLIFGNNCYAATGAETVSGTLSDSGTITPIISSTPIPPAVSLSLSETNLVNDAATPGSIAEVSTDITADVKNAEAYTLTLSVDSTTMTSGNTIISAGNVVNDNTWGYKWDGATSYTAPSTTGTSLTVPTVDSNGNSSFTKNLTFGVKFASDADAGHYKASGTLSLIASPKETAKITLADLTEMQQLSLVPEACANTPYLDGLNYSDEYTLKDVRDGKSYTVRKFADGRCWMVSNLQLSSAISMNYYTGGRVLNSTTTDIASNWTLPTSNASGFTGNSVSNTYFTHNYNWAYYSWCAATAGTCPSSGNATSSICPKGWTLPSGGENGEYQRFYNAIGSPDSSILRATPYNFIRTGDFTGNNNNLWGTDTILWTRTSASTTQAYSLFVNNDTINPGTKVSGRLDGYMIRCIARTV